jgi:hypothetical protein
MHQIKGVAMVEPTAINIMTMTTTLAQVDGQSHRACQDSQLDSGVIRHSRTVEFII